MRQASACTRVAHTHTHTQCINPGASNMIASRHLRSFAYTTSECAAKTAAPSRHRQKIDLHTNEPECLCARALRVIKLMQCRRMLPSPTICVCAFRDHFVGLSANHPPAAANGAVGSTEHRYAQIAYGFLMSFDASPLKCTESASAVCCSHIFQYVIHCDNIDAELIIPAQLSSL